MSLGLQPGESVDFVVCGDCMRGVDHGDSVPVRKQRVYLPGDVVVVRRRDHWSAHRFLGYAPSMHGIVALTQADEAAERDPAALVGAIVGRAQRGVSSFDRIAALCRYARALVIRLAEGRR